uniref:uncharacterized protein LOC122608631 n=1 Tax=Erigeron canadensis TaxID=72917 RepID=UPI001CB8A202|nr:uncharacterized protein LOC122608631 [Erigeron canadensis]
MTSNELCLPTTCNFNKNNNSSIIPKLFFHDISLLFSLIFSHPLYFSYFIFFSPYLFKFISFISPLFLTTTLLLLCILATTFPQPKLGFFQTIVDKLRSKMNVVVEEEDQDVEFLDFEDLEIYKIVFHDPPLILDIESFSRSTSVDEDNNDDDQLKQVMVMENTVRVMEKSEEERSLEKLFEELDRFEDSRDTIETKENKIISQRETKKLEINKLETSCEDKKIFEVKSNSLRTDSCSSFGSYGSMRKEKEWKRTLACKLFEERNNSGGEEGMDSLWESYEDDNASKKSRNRKETTIEKKKTTTKNKKSEFKYFYEGDDVDQDDDEEEFMSNGQLCCLKALKLSTGKMNLGMGKPNLVKITKALKGFGWLHHVGTKHGKKV